MAPPRRSHPAPGEPKKENSSWGGDRTGVERILGYSSPTSAETSASPSSAGDPPLRSFSTWEQSGVEPFPDLSSHPSVPARLSRFSALVLPPQLPCSGAGGGPGFRESESLRTCSSF